MIGGFWTPRAAQEASNLVAYVTPVEAEMLLREMTGMNPSKTSLDQVAKTLSAVWETDREAFEATLRQGETISAEATTVAISLDGMLVPMRDSERVAKRVQTEKKRATGPAGYREVGCATLSFYNAEGDRLSTLRWARMPEAKKATLCAQSALDAAYGEHSLESRAVFGKYRLILKESERGVDQVIRMLTHLRKQGPGRSVVTRELKYFRNQRARMCYATYLSQNLPIGSGVVETACKTLVAQRMKRSGMRWLPSGGQAILTLHARLTSPSSVSAARCASATACWSRAPRRSGPTARAMPIPACRRAAASRSSWPRCERPAPSRATWCARACT
jgi:hypothetical protein